MADAIVERKQQIGRRFLRAESSQRALCDLDKVHLCICGKHDLEFRHSAGQQSRNRTQHLPLRLAVTRRRQDAQERERVAQRLDCGKIRNQCRMPFLEMLRERLGVLVLAGRKAMAHVDRLAPVAGFGQQQFGNADPALDVRVVRAGQLRQSGTGVDRRAGAGLREVLRGIVGYCEQFVHEVVGQQSTHVRQRLTHDARKCRLERFAVVGAV